MSQATTRDPGLSLSVIYVADGHGPWYSRRSQLGAERRSKLPSGAESIVAIMHDHVEHTERGARVLIGLYTMILTEDGGDERTNWNAKCE